MCRKTFLKFNLYCVFFQLPLSLFTPLLPLITTLLSMSMGPFSFMLNSFFKHFFIFVQLQLSAFYVEFLKHAIPDYLVRGTDHFSNRLLKKMTIANTTMSFQNECIKITPIFCWISKNIFCRCATEF